MCRPIIIANVKRILELPEDRDFFTGMFSFFAHFLITRCMVPGRVENWIVLADMNGVDISELRKRMKKNKKENPTP